MNLQIRLSPARIALGLIVFSALLAVQSVILTRMEWNAGVNISYWLYNYEAVMNVSHEASVPAWYSSLLLLSCALLLLITAYAIHRQGSRSKWYWLLLGLIFLYMSIDEAAELHEILTDPMGDLLGFSSETEQTAIDEDFQFMEPVVEGMRLRSIIEKLGIEDYVYFGWVVVGVIVVGALGLVFVPFLLRLPKRTRWLFILAGAVFVGGAIGVESVSAKEYYISNGTSFRFSTLSSIEEFMEMTGTIIFMYALLDHLGTLVTGVEFQLPQRAAVPEAGVPQEEPAPQIATY